MLFVGRDSEEYAIREDGSRAEVGVPHELAHLLGARLVTSQKMLRPRETAFQWCQVCSERELRRISGDRYTSDDLPNETMVQVAVQILRSCNKARCVRTRCVSSSASVMVQ